MDTSAKSASHRPGGKMVPKKTALITDLDNTLFDWADLLVQMFLRDAGRNRAD